MYTPDETVIRSTILCSPPGCFKLFDGIQTAPLRSSRRGRHTHADVLPLHRLLDYWSSAGRLVVVSGVDGVR